MCGNYCIGEEVRWNQKKGKSTLHRVARLMVTLQEKRLNTTKKFVAITTNVVVIGVIATTQKKKKKMMQAVVINLRQ